MHFSSAKKIAEHLEDRLEADFCFSGRSEALYGKGEGPMKTPLVRPDDSRCAVLDRCQTSLRRTQRELEALSILFEHLQDSDYSADCLSGMAVTFSRLEKSVDGVVSLLNKIY